VTRFFRFCYRLSRNAATWAVFTYIAELLVAKSAIHEGYPLYFFITNYTRYYRACQWRETRNTNPDNPEFGTKGGNNTTDKIFLLNSEEAMKYFSESNARVAKLNGKANDWLLRSVGRSHDMGDKI